VHMASPPARDAMTLARPPTEEGADRTSGQIRAKGARANAYPAPVAAGPRPGRPQRRRGIAPGWLLEQAAVTAGPPPVAVRMSRRCTCFQPASLVNQHVGAGEVGVGRALHI